MRILYFGNNRLGCEVLRWLVSREEAIVGLVVHPPERGRCRDEIVAAAGLPWERVFDASLLRDAITVDRLQSLGADIGVSVLFGYILRAEVLDLPRRGVVNLHPALLPYNRGAYPNVWSIVDGTPAGVTLHYMDAGVDTGDIIAQCEVEVEPVDTGASLYRRLEDAGLRLFCDSWPALRSGTAPRRSQDHLAGTSHRVRDVDALDRIDLDRTYTARQLLDILRARTFPPHQGAYFEIEGRKVLVRLSLEYDQPDPAAAEETDS